MIRGQRLYDKTHTPSIEGAFFAFITAISKIVYLNSNKKSPRARSLNYAGNEYDFEYDFFQLLKNDGNDIFLKCAIFKRLRTYHAMMETVFEIC